VWRVLVGSFVAPRGTKCTDLLVCHPAIELLMMIDFVAVQKAEDGLYCCLLNTTAIHCVDT
jgi:hypothetical protein